MSNYKLYEFFFAAFLVFALVNAARAADPPLVTIGYTKHYGSSLEEQLTGIAHDTLGNAFIVGNRVDPSASTYGIDGFVRKYDALGALLWRRDRASASTDGVTTDKSGNAYIVGSYTAGSWPTQRDYIYLQRFDSTGTPLWTKQFTIPVANDRTLLTANAIATIRDNNFIVILFEKAYYPYQNRQVFIRKYNVLGRLLWEKQVSATSSPYAARPSLATDADGNIYVAANSVAYQRWNTSLTRLNAQGIAAWTVPFFLPTNSTQLTYVHALAADSGGNVYLTGITRGSLDGENKGYDDVFLRKYGPDGTALWTKQFGTDSSDYGNDLTVDSAGNIYVVGSTMGQLIGSNRGSYDAFVRKYNTSGQLVRGQQFGTSAFDIANAVCVGDDDAVYVGGNTNGNLGGTAKGRLDIYLRKYELFR
jgi:hypothetical protein